MSFQNPFLGEEYIRDLNYSNEQVKRELTA
jgi:hypothetical protein